MKVEKPDAAEDSHVLIAAFDPGRNIGFALVSFEGDLLSSSILHLAQAAVIELPPRSVVIIGAGTGSAELTEALVRRGLRPRAVDETGTSLIARDLYFRDHPPSMFQRLLPRGLRSPSRPIDDYAAYAIALRYLAFESDGEVKPVGPAGSGKRDGPERRSGP